MDAIIKDWTKKSGKQWAGELGCEPAERNAEFTHFTKIELKKRFHYLSFYVVVTGYNKTLVNDLIRNRNVTQPAQWCNGNEMGYFVYTKPHTDKLKLYVLKGLNVLKGQTELKNAGNITHQHERLYMLVTYIEKKPKYNAGCAPTLKLECPNNDKLMPVVKTPKNGTTCMIPHHYNDIVCGETAADFPVVMKYCYRGPQKMRSLLIGACF